MRARDSWLLATGVAILTAAIGLPYLLIVQMGEDISLVYGFLMLGLVGMLVTFVAVKRVVASTVRKTPSATGMDQINAERDKRLAPGSTSSQPDLSSELLIERIQAMTADLGASWVLFKRGTIVVLPEAFGDLRQRAIDFLQENGPVVPGTPMGDFSVCRIKKCPGWIVTSHDPNLNVYVGPEEKTGVADLEIGMYGRSKRNQDANELSVLHIEDKRRTPQLF